MDIFSFILIKISIRSRAHSLFWFRASLLDSFRSFRRIFWLIIQTDTECTRYVHTCPNYIHTTIHTSFTLFCSPFHLPEPLVSHRTYPDIPQELNPGSTWLIVIRYKTALFVGIYIIIIIFIFFHEMQIATEKTDNDNDSDVERIQGWNKEENWHSNEINCFNGKCETKMKPSILL